MRVQRWSSPFLIIVALTAVFALSACAANPYPTYRRERVDGYEPSSYYSPAEQRLRDESSFAGKSSMQGCLAGAAGVALITALITRDSRKTASEPIIATALTTIIAASMTLI